MPLRDPFKREIIANFKKNRDCSWVNSIRQSHVALTKMEKDNVSGWTTSFDVAMKLGMPHDSPVFLAVLANLKTESHEHWSDTGLEAAFKAAQLPRYYYDKAELVRTSEQDINSDEIGAAACGNIAKKGKFNILDGPGSSTDVPVVIAKPHQLEMAQLCKIAQGGMDKVEGISKEMRKMVAQMTCLPNRDVHVDRVHSLQMGIQTIESLGMEVLQLLAVADAVGDEGQAETLNVKLEGAKADLLNCQGASNELVQKTKAYLSSL